jgi:two-component system CheB/CheR fusion protein
MTCFLPHGPADDRAEQAPRTPQPHPIEDAARRRSAEMPRVLVVEDDASTVELMRRILTWQGYEVRSAPSFTEALHAASEWLPDVLISDLSLPGKSGFDVLQTMREAYPGLKAIVVSGYSSPEDVSRSREAGFAEHLGKPVDVHRLIDAIHRVLAQK